MNGYRSAIASVLVLAAVNAALAQTPPPGAGRSGGRVGTPGPKRTPADVKTYPASVPLYDASTIRTPVIDFEYSDWETELEVFYHTDVEVPATLRMDGMSYPEIGR